MEKAVVSYTCHHNKKITCHNNSKFNISPRLSQNSASSQQKIQKDTKRIKNRAGSRSKAHIPQKQQKQMPKATLQELQPKQQKLSKCQEYDSATEDTQNQNMSENRVDHEKLCPTASAEKTIKKEPPDNIPVAIEKIGNRLSRQDLECYQTVGLLEIETRLGEVSGGFIRTSLRKVKDRISGPQEVLITTQTNRSTTQDEQGSYQPRKSGNERYIPHRTSNQSPGVSLTNRSKSNDRTNTNPRQMNQQEKVEPSEKDNSGIGLNGKYDNHHLKGQDKSSK
ncbi:hypothetical protein C922_05054 [Plasmodium inui San Antonio 1]|uniref:Uncharacterized protein n=1 Tax=Plasmodium inui San Antonio 1 TaxID=1237626 RepID=W6ZZ67_9APIC|nr:hypothetical protein C922_05054 [Plasmodium inui San Antonio 1]EUD64583.1 hypothetical protein C922_05054 [Plasmodium inui San Antonio 1]